MVRRRLTAARRAPPTEWRLKRPTIGTRAFARIGAVSSRLGPALTRLGGPGMVRADTRGQPHQRRDWRGRIALRSTRPSVRARAYPPRPARGGRRPRRRFDRRARRRGGDVPGWSVRRQRRTLPLQDHRPPARRRRLSLRGRADELRRLRARSHVLPTRRQVLQPDRRRLLHGLGLHRIFLLWRILQGQLRYLHHHCGLPAGTDLHGRAVPRPAAAAALSAPGIRWLREDLRLDRPGDARLTRRRATALPWSAPASLERPGRSARGR